MKAVELSNDKRISQFCFFWRAHLDDHVKSVM
jgi:hypothetical protein